MRKIFIFFILALPLISHAQINWKWARCGGNDTSGNNAQAVTADASGNIYITGDYFGNPSYDSLHFTTYGAGYSDIFIAKFDSSGNLKWMKTAGSALNDDSRAIAVDISGNVYIAGTIGGPAQFGSNTYTAAGGYNNFFLAKMDTAGNFLWVNVGGTCPVLSSAEPTMTDMLIDNEQNLFITTAFRTSPTVYAYDSILLACDTATSCEQAPIVMKLDTAGNVIWYYVRDFGIAGDNGQGQNIKKDNSGNIIVQSLVERYQYGTISVAVYNDFMITKLDPTGHLLWEKEFGDSVVNNWMCYPQSMAVDVSNNIYVGGNYITGSFQIIPSISSGSMANYIAKLDSNGNPIWGKCSSPITFNTIAFFSNTDSFYCTGTYMPGIVDGITLTDTGLYVANIDSSGSVNWLLTYTNDTVSTYPYTINPVASCLSPSTYSIAGYFTGSVSFGINTITVPGAVNYSSNSDFFVATARTFDSLYTTQSSTINKLAGFDYSLYPNPTSAFLNIDITDKNNYYVVSVNDINGKTTYINKNVKSSIQIDINSLKSGNYYITVGNKGKQISKKFVVVH